MPYSISSLQRINIIFEAAYCAIERVHNVPYMTHSVILLTKDARSLSCCKRTGKVKLNNGKGTQMLEHVS